MPLSEHPGSPLIGLSDFNALVRAVNAAGRGGTYTRVVAASSESADVKAVADYVCDGTADEVQINAAINDVATVSVLGAAKGANGGKVILMGRLFEIAGPILIQSQVELQGAYGHSGTWIYPATGFAPGASGGMIELAHANAQYTFIRDLGLKMEGRNLCGIKLHMGAGQEYDGFHMVDNIYMWHPGQTGLHVSHDSGGRMRGNHFSNIRIIDPDVYGVWSQAPDSFYSNIDVGSAGSHAFYVNHSNNRYVNCKGWFADGSGFYIAGGRDNQLTACESQDNEQHGYYIGSARTTISSCTADSNSHNGSGVAGSYDGFHIQGNGANVHGSASDKNEGGRGRQQRYGVLISGSARVIVNVTTWQNATAPVSGSGASGSVVNVLDHT